MKKRLIAIGVFGGCWIALLTLAFMPSCSTSAEPSGPAISATSITSGTAHINTIRAKRIELVDEDGRTRIVLRGGDSGRAPKVEMLDEDGDPRAEILVSPLGTMATFYQDGKPRLSLDVSPDGGEIGLQNAAGKIVWRQKEPR